MSDLETVRGVLHGSVGAKRKGGIFDQFMVGVLTDMGEIDYTDRKFYYAPRYYLTNEATDSDDRFRLWSFKGQPKSLSLKSRGHVVTVRATIEYWPNGIGAYLVRPRILEVSDEKAVGHCCSSPGSCGIKEVPMSL